MCFIERTSCQLVKIHWRTVEEQIQKINDLRAKRIISVKPSIPGFTATQWYCSDVYYEYYL